MTRKDYITLAAAFVRCRPLAIDAPLPAASQWLTDVGSIARALHADNPLFDQARFIDACMAPKPEKQS